MLCSSSHVNQKQYGHALGRLRWLTGSSLRDRFGIHTGSAVAILNAQKGGGFIVLEAKVNYESPARDTDFCEIGGCSAGMATT